MKDAHKHLIHSESTSASFVFADKLQSSRATGPSSNSAGCNARSQL